MWKTCDICCLFSLSFDNYSTNQTQTVLYSLTVWLTLLRVLSLVWVLWALIRLEPASKEMGLWKASSWNWIGPMMSVTSFFSNRCTLALMMLIQNQRQVRTQMWRPAMKGLACARTTHVAQKPKPLWGHSTAVWMKTQSKREIFCTYPWMRRANPTFSFWESVLGGQWVMCLSLHISTMPAFVSLPWTREVLTNWRSSHRSSSSNSSWSMPRRWSTRLLLSYVTVILRMTQTGSHALQYTPASLASPSWWIECEHMRHGNGISSCPLAWRWGKNTGCRENHGLVGEQRKRRPSSMRTLPARAGAVQVHL